MTDPAAHTPDWSQCNCGAGPLGIHSRWCALAAAHTPDVDTLVEKLTIALTWVPWDRRREADAALSDLAATARERSSELATATTTMELAIRQLQAAEAELEQERTLREEIEDDHWPYEWQVATAEREKRKAAEADRDGFARRVAELEAAARVARAAIWPVGDWEAREKAAAALDAVLAGDGGGA